MHRKLWLALGVFALGLVLTFVSPASCLGDEPMVTAPQPSWAFLPGIGKVTVLDFTVEDDGLYLVTPAEMIRIIPKAVRPAPPARGESSYWSWLVIKTVKDLQERGMATPEQIRRALTDTLHTNGAPKFNRIVVKSAGEVDVYWHGAERPVPYLIISGYPTPEEVLATELASFRASLRQGMGFILAPNAPKPVSRADSEAVQREIDEVIRITPLPPDEVQRMLAQPSASRDWGLNWWRGEYLTQFMVRQFLYPKQWVRKSR